MSSISHQNIAMEECKIGNEKVKIYGIAKGSGMIHPNIATTLAYIFTDASLSNDILSLLAYLIMEEWLQFKLYGPGPGWLELRDIHH